MDILYLSLLRRKGSSFVTDHKRISTTRATILHDWTIYVDWSQLQQLHNTNHDMMQDDKPSVLQRLRHEVELVQLE